MDLNWDLSLRHICRVKYQGLLGYFWLEEWGHILKWGGLLGLKEIWDVVFLQNVSTNISKARQQKLWNIAAPYFCVCYDFNQLTHHVLFIYYDLYEL